MTIADEAFHQFGVSGKGIGNYESDRVAFMAGFAAALDAAIATVERQTDLTELMHFDRPSDYRKGVLTSLAALHADRAALA